MQKNTNTLYYKPTHKNVNCSPALSNEEDTQINQMSVYSEVQSHCGGLTGVKHRDSCQKGRSVFILYLALKTGS